MMNTTWIILGAALCGFALYISPPAAVIAALGAAIMLLAHINSTMGKVVRLGMEAARAYTYGQDNCVPALQAFCIAMIQWRKI